MPEKMNPLNIQPIWGKYDKLPPWGYLSSKDLSIIFGVHLQSISNWACRSVLPVQSEAKHLHRNKKYYQKSSIMAWLSGITEEEATWEWINHNLDGLTITSIDQAKYIIKYAPEIVGLT